MSKRFWLLSVFSINISILVIMLAAYIIGIPDNYMFTVYYNTIGEAWIEIFLMAFAVIGNFYIMTKLTKDKVEILNET